MSDSDSDRDERDGDDKKGDNLSDDKVVNKYKTAAEIAENAVQHVASLCRVDAKIVDLCNAGDTFVNEAVSKVYVKPVVEKGVAFPTCVSVNHVIGHFCPLSDADNKLAAGDLIKIDLAVHIDGFIACMAHTILLGANGIEAKITGRKADVMMAAYTAAEAAIRLLKPGKKNKDISAAIGKAAAEFKCSPVQGVLSHQISRFIIDGDKVILNKPDLENKVDDHEFEVNEAYCLDIVMSTAEGKAKESDFRTTVFKRAVDHSYQLKLKASRELYTLVSKKFPTFPFSIRYCDEKKAKFAITELRDHELVHAYPVLIDNDGEFIAHIKFTCLILKNGTIRITGNKLVSPANLSSDHKVTDKDLLAILATSTGPSKKKNNKKKKAAKTAEEAKAVPAATGGV